MKNGVLAERIRVFNEEFPFVHRYIPHGAWWKRPTVERVDLDLISCRGEYCCSMIAESTRFLLIDEKGEELGEVKQFARPRLCLWKPSTWIPLLTKGETVLQAIERLPDSSKVAYILQINDELPTLLGYAVHIVKVVVHKVPSGWCFSDWLANLKDVAEQELKRDLAKVDQV